LQSASRRLPLLNVATCWLRSRLLRLCPSSPTESLLFFYQLSLFVCEDHKPPCDRGVVRIELSPNGNVYASRYGVPGFAGRVLPGSASLRSLRDGLRPPPAP
jgi:hypothetical protein